MSPLDDSPTASAFPFPAYLGRVADLLHRPGTSEGSFYPALADLLQRSRVAERERLRVTVLPRGEEAGYPDLKVGRGERGTGYVEVKRIGAPLDVVADSPQLARYRRHFPNLLLTDGLDFRLFRDGGCAGRARLAKPPVDGLPPYPLDRGAEETARLLDAFLTHGRAAPATSRSLAVALGREARLLEAAVEALLAGGEAAGEPFRLLHRALAHELLPELDRAGFADLYAQTVAYGLLAARWWNRDCRDRRSAFFEIPESLGVLRELFRLAHLEDPPEELGWVLDGLVGTLAAVDLEAVFRRRPAEGAAGDPVLDFYETFLTAYDAGERKRRGVYYTPRELVSWVVGSVDALLERDLGFAGGLADPRVRVLDPAAGTMSFLIEAMRRSVERTRRVGAGLDPEAVVDDLLARFHGFEVMIAPYTVAHLAVQTFLRELGGGDAPRQPDRRFPLYLTDALDPGHGRQPELPGTRALARESEAARALKLDGEVTVVLGNPPYSGHSVSGGAWIEGLVRESYYRVGGRELGERNPKWLQDDYVRFLRFAEHKIEHARRGIVAFVTNHGYLDNPTFRGLRDSWLDTFDRIYLLDLHGNRKKRERAPDGSADGNVFGIEQGVAVALLVKTGEGSEEREEGAGDRRDGSRDPGERGGSRELGERSEAAARGGGSGSDASGRRGEGRARVLRADLRGSASDKLAWLAAHTVEDTPWEPIDPHPPGFFFVARDRSLAERWHRLTPLERIFEARAPGIVTGRDAFVVDVAQPALVGRIGRLFSAPTFEALPEAGLEDLRERSGFSLEAAWRALRRDPAWEERIEPYLFRPFDSRFVFYADYLLERPRGAPMRWLLHRGAPEPPNLALVVPKQGREGPAAFVADRLVAHKAVSAYDINYVFPLWRGEGGGGAESGLFPERRPSNLRPELVAALGELHGMEPAAEEVLGYVYGVLWSPSYRERWAELLTSEFPRLPWPASRELFAEVAEIGRRLVDLHRLDPAAGAVGTAAETTAGVRFGPAGEGWVAQRRSDLVHDEATGRLQVSRGGQGWSGVPRSAWERRIGGHRVIESWLLARKDEVLTPEGLDTFRRIVGALAETSEIEARLGPLYEEVEQEAAEAVSEELGP